MPNAMELEPTLAGPGTRKSKFHRCGAVVRAVGLGAI